MGNCHLVLVVFFLCSVLTFIVTNASQESSGEKDKKLLECTECTTLCGASTCWTRLDKSGLVFLLLNGSCLSSAVNVVIPPEERDTISLQEAQQTCRGYWMLHRHSCMTTSPINLCQFPATKMVDFSFNWLTEFPNLSCLTELVVLDLRSNSITAVPRDAFVGLTKLRDIFLDSNQIIHVDPFAFSTPLPHLNNVDLRHNKLETAEMWFMNIFHRFCEFSLANNHISRFTNEQGFNITSIFQRKAGPGYVSFAHNKIRQAPTAQLQQYGVRHFQDLVPIIDWAFSFRNNLISCDCDLYDYLTIARQMPPLTWDQYLNNVCDSPPDLRGTNIAKISLDKLVCNITDGCPGNCTCQYQRSKNLFHVDCKGAWLKSLPDIMPQDKRLNVTLANNSIEVLETRNYLERLVSLDLTYNGLMHVDPETPRLLKNIKKLDLRGNQIAYLPDTLQILPSSVVALDPYTLSCDCRMSWFSSWRLLSSQTSDEGYNSHRFLDAANVSDAAIFCLLQDGTYISMIEATNERLACVRAITPVSLIVAVAVLASIVLCGVALMAIFRYEILVLYHVIKERRCWALHHKPRHTAAVKDAGHQKRHHQQRRLSAHGFMNDVFISCTDNDTDLDWVINRLLPILDQQGVKSYLLARDSPPGVVSVDEAVKNIRDSHVVLVVLSVEYAASATCLFQFSQAYNFTLGRSAGEAIKKDRRRLLVLEVDGGARYGQVGEPHLKAMLRMRMTLCADNPRDMERVGQVFDEIL